MSWPCDLMDEAELKRSYRGRLAIHLSIDKHERARSKRNWEELCSNPEMHFGSTTCALCIRHLKDELIPIENSCQLKQVTTCKGCPLLPKGKETGCEEGSTWDRACDAIIEKNRSKFMRYSLKLIKQLKEALPNG